MLSIVNWTVKVVWWIEKKTITGREPYEEQRVTIVTEWKKRNPQAKVFEKIDVENVFTLSWNKIGTVSTWDTVSLNIMMESSINDRWYINYKVSVKWIEVTSKAPEEEESVF